MWSFYTVGLSFTLWGGRTSFYTVGPQVGKGEKKGMEAVLDSLLYNFGSMARRKKRKNSLSSGSMALPHAPVEKEGRKEEKEQKEGLQYFGTHRAVSGGKGGRIYLYLTTMGNMHAGS